MATIGDGVTYYFVVRASLPNRQYFDFVLQIGFSSCGSMTINSGVLLNQLYYVTQPFFEYVPAKWTTVADYCYS